MTMISRRPTLGTYTIVAETYGDEGELKDVHVSNPYRSSTIAQAEAEMLIKAMKVHAVWVLADGVDKIMYSDTIQVPKND